MAPPNDVLGHVLDSVLQIKPVLVAKDRPFHTFLESDLVDGIPEGKVVRVGRQVIQAFASDVRSALSISKDKEWKKGVCTGVDLRWVSSR